MPRGQKRSQPEITVQEESTPAPDLTGPIEIEGAEKLLKKAKKTKAIKNLGTNMDEKLSAADRAQMQKDKAALKDMCLANPKLAELLQQDEAGVDWIDDLTAKDTKDRIQRARVLMDGNLDEGLAGEVIGTTGGFLEWMAGGALDGLANELNDELVVDASKSLMTSRVFSKLPSAGKLAAMIGSRIMRVYSRNKAARQVAAVARANSLVQQM